MEKLKPMGSRVLVKRAGAEKSKGGILLPDSAQEKPKQGIVIAIGSGDFSDSNLKEGDRVMFSPYGGTEVKMGGQEDYLILPKDEILCVIEG